MHAPPQEGSAPREIDLAAVARRLWTLPVAALVVVGALLGVALDRARGDLAQSTFSLQLPPIDCPVRPGRRALPFVHDATFPAAVIEGRGLLDTDIPRGLRDHTLTCRIRETPAQASASCRVLGDHPDRVQALATSAARQLASMGDAPVSKAVAEHRIFTACGWSFFVELMGQEEYRGPTPPGSRAPPSEMLGAWRISLAANARLVSEPTVAPPRRREASAPTAGAVAALLGCALVAAWQERRRRASASQEEPPPASRAEEALLAGLLLTASMDSVMTWEVAGFTLRIGHLCALGLLLAQAVPRLRRREPLSLPAWPVLAALLYLTVAAASAFRSELPQKSAGYLAWAVFDLVAVFASLSWYASTPARLARALRLWLSGMALAAGMGAVQLLMWHLYGTAPFVEMTVDGFPRICGFSYEPSYFALYLVPGAALAFTRFALLGRPAWRSGLLGAFLALAVAVSMSRSGWLGLCAGAALVLVLAGSRLGRSGWNRAGISAVAAAGAVVLVLAAWPTMRAKSSQMARAAFDRWEKSSTGPRIEALRQAATMLGRHPILGVGFGGYGAYVLSHPEMPQPVGDASSVVTTNLYLELGAETGLVGLAAALAMLAAILAPLASSLLPRRGTGPPDAAAAAKDGLFAGAVVVFLVLFQFSQTLWRLDIWVLLALAFAAGLGSRRTAASVPDPATATPDQAPVAAVPAAGSAPP